MIETSTAGEADGETELAPGDRTFAITVRSALFNVAFYTTFIALMVFGLPAIAGGRRATMVVVRVWAKTSIWLLQAICGTRIEFRNLHLLPKGASILAVKHQSFLETFALIIKLDDFSYILKKELGAVPFFGWWVKATDQIELDRSKHGSAIARLQMAVQEKLRLGRQVIIFPEGTRRPIGASPDYKVGVAALCARSAVPCTPVALNTGLFWPRRSFRRRPGTVVIEFLPPIAAGLTKREFMNALQGAIEPATNALMAEACAVMRRGPAAPGGDAARPLQA